MIDFEKIPEALDYVAGQDWLTPRGLVRVDRNTSAAADGGPPLLHWRAALREIARILRRTRLI